MQRADGGPLPVRRPGPAGADLARPGELRRSRRPGRRHPSRRRGPLGRDGPGPGGAVAGDRRPRPRPARRRARQQPLEARGRLAVHPADDAARRVVAVPGVRPALGRGRAVRRPVRAGRVQGRASSGSTSGRSPPGPAPSRPCARRSSAASSPSGTSPGPKWSAGLFYEEGLYNFYNDSPPLGRPRVPALPVPRDVELPDRRPGLLRALLRHGLRVLGRRRRPTRVHRRPRRLRGALSSEHAFPLLGPGRRATSSRRPPSTATRPTGQASTTSARRSSTAIVRPLPNFFGRPSKSRLAFRFYGGFGAPDNAPLFRLGGGRRLRALDLSQFTGSSVWLSTLEWRYPLWRNIDRDAARPHRRLPQPAGCPVLRRRRVLLPRPGRARWSMASASACGLTSRSSRSWNAPPFASTWPRPSASG